MSRIKTSKDIAHLREGGWRLSRILAQVSNRVRPGISTGELNVVAERLIREGGDEPAFLGYKPDGNSVYPATLCVSVNDELVHGIPGERVLNEGDIVSLDLGIKHKNLYTDMAVTVPVGIVTKELKKLIQVTRESLNAGINAAVPGKRIGDIGYAIEQYVKPHKYGIVTYLGGHGVGHQIHEQPFISNMGVAGTGEMLEKGMVLALEPILTQGSGRAVLARDGFTFKTKDQSLAAHFEHTILITDGAPDILTKA